MLVGSRTGMIRRLAVILTRRVLELFPVPGEGFTLTGVITSFEVGGVLGLGGLMVTLTSIGDCLLSEVTQKPALAVIQLVSDQARSDTAVR